MDELHSAHVEEGLHQLEVGVLRGKTRALQRTFRDLARALADCVKRGHMDANPCDRIDTPRDRAEPGLAFDRADLASILRASDQGTGEGDDGKDTFSLLVHILAGTGARIGEVLALRWKHVDLERGRVRIEGTLREDKDLSVGPPKTRAALRELYLHDDLRSRLTQHKARSGTLGRPEAFVLTSRSMRPLRPSLVLRRHWHPLLKRLRLQRTGFHSLRRTFASLALEEGASPAAVAAVLGQTDQRVLLEHYSRSSPRQALGVFERVGNAVSAATSSDRANQERSRRGPTPRSRVRH